MPERISLDTQIEDLALKYPKSVGFLTRQGIRCIRCGEPVWGTLSELLEEAGIENPEALVAALNEYLETLEKPS